MVGRRKTPLQGLVRAGRRSSAAGDVVPGTGVGTFRHETVGWGLPGHAAPKLADGVVSLRRFPALLPVTRMEHYVSNIDDAKAAAEARRAQARPPAEAPGLLKVLESEVHRRAKDLGIVVEGLELTYHPGEEPPARATFSSIGLIFKASYSPSGMAFWMWVEGYERWGLWNKADLGEILLQEEIRHRSPPQEVSAPQPDDQPHGRFRRRGRR